jgi:murein DD-endopeptidase MepM/ murein hydrolase activator NlpD
MGCPPERSEGSWGFPSGFSHKESQKYVAAVGVCGALICARVIGAGRRGFFCDLLRLKFIGLPVLILLAVPFAAAQRLEFSWPTPNPAWSQGRDYTAWVQPTVSGEAESGMFGCVRTSGRQFHEGLDIRATGRDRHGEATDVVTAAMDGVVRHVSHAPGGSNYGRYIVIEHPGLTPAVYTLYAHLARIESGIRPGAAVHRGATLGIMGRSASGSAIPKERAHLHFEIGFVATSQTFSSWYAWKKFGNPNEHGAYNGRNLMGIDPNDFLREWRRKRVDNVQEYLDRMRAVVRVRVAVSRTPDFIRRYPSLLRKPVNDLVAGWEVECNATGLPFAWTPLTAAELGGQRAGTAKIVSADPALLRAARCKSLAKAAGGGYTPGADLTTMLQLVFGLRQ